MNEEGWAVAFEDAAPGACADRALVLTSLDIPHRIVEHGARYLLVVPAELVERAKFELWQYEQENRPTAKPVTGIKPGSYDALPGVGAYLFTIGLFAWFSSEAVFGIDWRSAGRMDGVLLRAGELWRGVTALTLHLDLEHLLGNMGFGALFGYFAGRLLGSGVSWLTIIIAAAGANGLNTLLLDTTHRSIGASTAVFAALGVLSGYVWRGRIMAQERWPYRLGPIIGGAALLAYTGTGSENTDIGAHLMGYLCGLAAGMALVPATAWFGRPRVQQFAAGAALLLLLGSWGIAVA